MLSFWDAMLYAQVRRSTWDCQESNSAENSSRYGDELTKWEDQELATSTSYERFVRLLSCVLQQ